MSNSQDLEKIVGQLRDSPGHILGLNGWLLRTLPKNKRVTFLRGFEKLVRLAYFPDHAPDARSRNTWEKYIQAVSQAVKYLTSDDFAFELAVENVPTEKNPLIKLRTEMEQKEREYARETSSLKQKLDLSTKEIKNVQSVSQDLRRTNAFEAKRASILFRLQEHNRKYLAHNTCYEIRSEKPFSISGYFIDFDRKCGMDLLQAAVFRNMSGLESAYTHLREIIENNFLLGEKESFRFRKKKALHGDYYLRIRGGLTIGSFQEFIALKNLLKGATAEPPQETFRKDMASIQDTILSIPTHGGEFTDDIDLSYFSVPVINIGMSILVKETLRMSSEYLPERKRNLPTRKNSLFYVVGINPYT